ncbi:MAG: helix-turn-helix domain-containing protein [Thermoplasmataceae archaeon]
MARSGDSSVQAEVELKRADCDVTNLIKHINLKGSVSRLKISSELTLHRIESNDQVSLVTELRKAAIKFTQAGNNTVWAESRSCSACRAMALSEAAILSTRSVGTDAIIYRIIVPSKRSLYHLKGELEKAGLEPRVIEFFDNEDEELTKREMDIIRSAFSLGYYDIDRGISMTELAQKFGISTSSISDVLRRGTKKIIKSYLENR